ncbi:Carnitine O-acetyltransferase [Holothuria leucospilota]|uniref:Carnitine O-acetyltransferase n=1 Tax=Holothuria leucospilota TaxID=206669 RepID=A0A9Q1BUT9_HOLLE|nr:Carnitine O-acetyltransferase [Holothuria leucospilota]
MQLAEHIPNILLTPCRHEYPPIKMGKQPICMDQFFLAFSSCRIPGRIVDTFYSHRVDLPDAPRHIVVIRNNHMFKFDILEPDKSPLDAASILKQLEYIVNQTDDQGPPIGLVTAHQRTRWADLYSKMKEVLRWLKWRECKKTERLSSYFARSGLTCPQKLKFVLSEDLSCAMAEAGKNIDHILGYFGAQERVFSSFGKTFLQSHKVAHDGFVQTAVQMTYWRIFGKFPRVWEAVSLQRFKLGRLDHIRTVTSETTAFIKLFHDENVQSVDKVLMLYKAVKAHRKSIYEAQMGHGIERHLFGLQRLAEEEEIDASDFYDDPSWKKSSSIDIRVTTMQGDSIRAVYSPMILKSTVLMWYSFNPDFMRFSITAREDKTEIDVNEFLEGLFVCMLDLKDLLESVLHPKN